MGKRRLLWGIWLLFALLLYFFENNLSTRTLLAVSVLMPCVSILLAAGSAKRTSAFILAPQDCVRGREADCAVRVSGLLPGALLCARLAVLNPLTAEEGTFALAVSARSKKRISVTAAHGGTMRFSLAEARVEDMFGLWQSSPLRCEAAYMTVSPPLFPVDITLAQRAVASPEGEQWSMNRPGFDPSETYAIRAYLPGDPIRQIHWKLSEKTGVTMLRELGLPIEEKILLLLDTTIPERGFSPAQTDAAVTALLSLSGALLQSGTAHSVGWKNRVLDELELCEIRTEQEWSAMQERLLGQASAPDSESVCTCFHKWRGGALYAHTVLCAAAFPQDLSVLCGGNRVTLLLFGALSAAETARDVSVQVCPPDSVRETLKQIEI